MSSPVAILEARRTPIGRFLGAFRNTPAVDLGAAVVSRVLDGAGVRVDEVDEVVFGHARQAGNGPNPGRQVAIAAGIPDMVPAATVNSACASGLHAVMLGADAIRLGRARVVVAGGMENMTRTPYLLDRARLGYRLGHDRALDGMYRDGFDCPLAGMLMGETAEVLAREYGIGREEQDRWALMSQRRVEAAVAAGRFADEITPVTATDDRGHEVTVDADEHPRAGVTMEALGKLEPVFDVGGTVTAGNASGITDGAAAVVLCSEAWARESGVEALATIRDYVITGVEPRRMGIGPVPAVRRILDAAGLALDDVPVIELNEAFAAQVIACRRELDFDDARVNPNGGAIGLGHPIGATGARILVTLLYEMKRRGVALGIATLCVSGGMGAAMLVERR